MALGLTQLLTKISTRNIFLGVRRPMRRANLTNFNVPNVMKSVSLNLLEPYGSVQACIGIALPFYLLKYRSITPRIP
jgi:hypothetical protein